MCVLRATSVSDRANGTDTIHFIYSHRMPNRHFVLIWVDSISYKRERKEIKLRDRRADGQMTLRMHSLFVDVTDPIYDHSIKKKQFPARQKEELKEISIKFHCQRSIKSIDEKSFVSCSERKKARERMEYQNEQQPCGAWCGGASVFAQ